MIGSRLNGLERDYESDCRFITLLSSIDGITGRAGEDESIGLKVERNTLYVVMRIYS